MSRKKYNTPHRSHVVKTRMNDDEYDYFTTLLTTYGISQSEFIRRAISGAKIQPIVRACVVNNELLDNIAKLTAEYGKIGSNLNQIARQLNEWRSPYPAMASEFKAAASELAALKFEVLKKVGDALGDIQTYQLQKR